MRPCRIKLSPTQVSAAVLLAMVSFAGALQAQAADVTWNNAAGSFAWNASDQNWVSGVWNNAAGNGAIFGATGVGAMTLGGTVSANSLSFTANGYSLNGPGTLNLVSGSSTAGTGFINVGPGVTTAINTAINSNVGLIKSGGGTLQLSGPLNVTGGGAGMAFAVGGYTPRLVNDVIVGGVSEISQGGTLQIMNSNVLPASTRMGIGNGLLDIGSNNVTVAQLNFSNQADYLPWDPSINASGAGVIGTGTLHVTGDINVMGVGAGNDGANTIATNLDIGGGTQVIRTTGNGYFNASRALQIVGSISNGSLLKTFGYTENGVMGVPDGLGLYGNNTYTGSTILNGGTTVITGTNASSLLKVVGSAGPAGSQAILQGANGSFLQAATIQAFAGGQFIIDNTGAMPAGGDYPTIPAAQNNNRIADNAEVQLRNGTFAYKGLANTAASETFGKLNAIADHNIVSLSTSGTGTTTLTASELDLGPRATLQVASATLGGANKLFITGAMPAADSTGVLQRMVGSNDFLTYNATTGVTPLAASAYSSSFAAGANVALTAASTLASSTTINALKRTGSFTTTIAAGQTLGISSGMILNTSGTGTFSGGTVDFGANPGVFFGGTNNIASAVTGTGGLLNSSSTVTLSGDLSGLSGTISNIGQTATTTISTNTFAGTLELRAGYMNINASQTLAGQGAILVGAPENDANTVATPVFLSIAGAGANAVIARNIIVNNGSQTAAGQELRYGYISELTPLSNTTGSQTISGNVTINSAFRLQGGAPTTKNTGSTNFTGNIDGSAPFIIVASRANFSGNVGNTGGFRIGDGGFTTQVTFSGTTSGSVPLTMVGGNGTVVSYAPGSLPTGTITFQDGQGASGAVLTPLASSTINNTITASNADITTNVGAGITSTWTGPVTGPISTYLTKQGDGTLVLTNAANVVGSTKVNGGTLLVNGGLGGFGVAVNTGGTVGGTGTIAGQILVNAGGTVAPGTGIGTLSADSLALSGTLLEEIELNNGGPASADLLKLGTAGVSLGGGTLQLSLADLGGSFTSGTYLLLSQAGSSAIIGTFANMLGVPAGYTVSVDYAFSGTDSLGRVGDGNDLAVTITAVPEPSQYAMFGVGLVLLSWLRSRRRNA